MNQKSLLIWVVALVTIVIGQQLYTKIIMKRGENMDMMKIEQKLTQAISISENINNDNNLSSAQKIEMQVEVDTLLSQVQHWAINLDNKNMAFEQKVQYINMQAHQKELDVFLESVLKQWNENNITIDEQQLTLIKSHWQSPTPISVLNNTYFEIINKAISQTSPSQEIPQWLHKMDAFFSQKQFVQGEPFLSNSRIFNKQYSTLLTLTLPLVSFDQIIRMKSLDDDFIRINELNLFTNLDIPRNVDEAEKIYAAILKLPKKSIVHSTLGTHESDQAFRAQMFMVLLLKNQPENKTLHNFQKKIVSEAPDYLFNYPDYGSRNLGTSPRPAFYMAYNTDSEIRKMIAQRSTSSFLHHVKEVETYENEKQKFEQIVSTNKPIDTRPISERVAADQLPLAELLEKFDVILKKRHVPLRPPLNDEQIEKLKAYLAPLELPEAYLTLYKWHDGFLSNYYNLNIFQPIAQNLQEYEHLKEYTETDKWFPFRSDNGDTFWLVDLMHPKSTVVTHFSMEDSNYEKDFASIEQMIFTYVEAIKKDILHYNPNTDDWETDEGRFDAIKKCNNI